MNSISFDMSPDLTKESDRRELIEEPINYSIEIPCKKRGKKTKKQNEKEIMKNYFDEIATKSSELTPEEYILDDCDNYPPSTDSDQNSQTSHTPHTPQKRNTKTTSSKKRGGGGGGGNNENTFMAGNTNIENGGKINGTKNGAKPVTKPATKPATKTSGSSPIENKMMKPKNASQEQYVQYLTSPEKKIIFAIGPAGTGKTLFATQHAIKHFLLGNYDKIIFTRPTVSVDEDIGFLPGTIEEKLSPWLRPIFDILYEFITVKEVQAFLEEKVFEMAPIGYLRGRTFKRSIIIADEMQNCTQNQMKMLLTRLGENSRMVVTGDLEQHDRTGETNGLADFLFKLRKRRTESIELIEFERNDILREPIIKEVLEIYNL